MLNYISLLVSIVSLMVAIWARIFDFTRAKREDLILQPRFSIEKSKHKNGKIWRIYNTGGNISNQTIYPEMYLSLFYMSQDGEEREINIQVIDYFDNCFEYRNSDGAFFLQDKNTEKLGALINKIQELHAYQDITLEGYSLTTYMIIHYTDYKNKTYNKIYQIADDDYSSYTSNQIYGETMQILAEIKQMPTAHICLNMHYEDKNCVKIYYHKSETSKITRNDQEYFSYLEKALNSLLQEPIQTVDEMEGDVIVMDGTLLVKSPKGDFECVSTGVIDAGVGVNKEGDFYLSWTTLWGDYCEYPYIIPDD